VRAVAIIPARGGSKGVPRKNLRVVGGHPLIAWSIFAAAQSELIERIVVSSDDEEILSEAVRYGAAAVHRPAELAGDDARIEDALIHAFDHDPTRGPEPLPDFVVTLQPTAPVRRPGLIDDCIRALLDKPWANAALTVVQVGVTWWLEEDLLSPRKAWVNQFGSREIPQRQAWKGTDDRLAEDGSVFVTRYQALMRTRDRRARPITVVENEQTVDIDTERDLIFASALLASTDVFRRAVVA